MQARYDYVEKLKEEVNGRLRELTRDPIKYQELIQNLIIQVPVKTLRACSG